MATTNSITSSTSTTTLSPFDITTNSTTTYLPLNNQLIPPVSSNLILPTSRFYNCNPIENTINILARNLKLLQIVKHAFESLTLANYQKLAANKNVGIKSELPPPTSQINGIEALNIPPTINNLNNNFSTNKQQNLASLEQQLLVLLNLQQQQPQHSQNDCTSNSNNLNVATVINNVFGIRENLIKNSANLQQQQSTQQNSLESFHFKDDKIQERKNCSIRRSSSSVSYYKTCSNSNADVSEHFKRTFSGKWPKRSSTSLRFGRMEEHFRKSLGDDRFKQIRNNQRYNQEDDTNAMDDDIDV
uniref:Uncharacterized protein n=1 Tax=Meloidogyne javanica TaxID=6303 RepID=A0A915N5C5_MELJA